MSSFPATFSEMLGVIALDTICEDGMKETVLLLKDQSPFVLELAKLRPFKLNNKSLFLKTPYGCVCILLFWIATPGNENKPYAIYEKYLNIYKPEMMEPYYQLTNQAYLHFFIVNEHKEILNTFEFVNFFLSSDLRKIVSQIITAHKQVDIHAAIQYIQQQFSLDDLFAMDT